MCRDDVRKYPEFEAPNGFWTEIPRFSPKRFSGPFARGKLKLGVRSYNAQTLRLTQFEFDRSRSQKSIICFAQTSSRANRRSTLGTAMCKQRTNEAEPSTLSLMNKSALLRGGSSREFWPVSGHSTANYAPRGGYSSFSALLEQ